MLLLKENVLFFPLLSVFFNFLPVMLWPLVIQDNFHFMKHNVSGHRGNCRWNMAGGNKLCKNMQLQLWSERRKNYEWKVFKLVRTVIVKWCREIIERCITISVKLKTMRVYRLLKASTFASRAPLHSRAGPRGLSSIGFLSRLFGASPSEPRPKKDPRYQTVHGVELQDDFHWLKKRGSKVNLTAKFPAN